jgi:hypothetical protein
MGNTQIMTHKSSLQRWSGIAFMVGNLLFAVNKLDEMSLLFLSRPIPDVISGENPGLIILGQVALIIGYIGYQQFYAARLSRSGKLALRAMAGGGIVLAFGHISFMTTAESLFILVILGVGILLVGLIWFGIINLREKILRNLQWLPLATGLMGFIGFILFGGEEITALFLLFRTLFALGLITLGFILSREKPFALPPGN